ncbi:MAG: tRNA threonylcarbamoyladenosine dehydratase [Clostridia bacterium]|jgi:tRNA A37 threonylcarbamoyladenosine dehydratase|nr:tRNA threonylcarbamoyladenosine dehydratase [Clostridia bacterium]MCI9291305.1 tRNA threonylcarbamoyladenosine dehydratase [Clostridia bacterium]
MFSREIKLIGDDGLQRLFASRVLVVGVGGVGGYVVEMLARAGVGTIGMMDKDVVDISNKNRQIIALDSTLGMPKVKAFEQRIKDINANCSVISICERFSADNTYVLDMGWDMVVDAIDSFADKVELICLAKQKGLDIISAGGAGNRVELCDFEICDIYKTSYDPLAKKLRKALKDRGIKNLDICYTKSPAIVCDGVGSISYIPPLSGIKIAGYVVGRLLEK